MIGTGQYVLKDKVPVLENDTLAWGQWMEDNNRRVAHTMVKDIRISTVFLGLDHNFNDAGPPLLFETMVFENGFNDTDWARYATWDEAVAGHDAMVLKVQGLKEREG